MANEFPVVLVHGLLGWGPDEVFGVPYWGVAQQVASPLERFAASVGPISSSHDRACELAFQIKGGRVDYGAEHAQREGHDRFGRTYPAFYPQWSQDEPVHLVGHSMGGPTIWMLQHLLATDYFGWGSNASWVKSLCSISGVLNGSTATYFFGADEHTGLLDEHGIGHFLGRVIELHVRMTGDLFDRLYDFDLDHWGIAQPQFLDSILGQVAESPMFRGKDNAAYSLTIQGLHEQNSACQTNPETYYLSYVTEQSIEGFLTRHHYPEAFMNPFLIPTSLYIGGATYHRPFYPGFESPDWWHNDGLVSVYSQMYPRVGGNHPVGGRIEPVDTSEPGKWYYDILDSTDHTDIVLLPELHRVGDQKRFYRNLFERLAAL